MTAPRPSHHVDTYAGHVTVFAANGVRIAEILDFGDVVRVEHVEGVVSRPWTEDEAREVGAALIGWAGRKRLARASTVKEEA